jgi:hypothetical protein
MFLAACGDASNGVTPQDSSPSGTRAEPSSHCQTFSVSAYPLSQDPKDAVAFEGNVEIFEATVEQVDPATKVMQPGKPVPFLVYVPVRVNVTKVYKGTARVGTSVVLRDLGGTAADCTSFVTDSIPDDAWVPGTDLFVFANEPTSPEGNTGLTPNWVFVAKNGRAISLENTDKLMDLQEMRAGVTTRWPRT